MNSLASAFLPWTQVLSIESGDFLMEVSFGTKTNPMIACFWNRFIEFTLSVKIGLQRTTLSEWGWNKQNFESWALGLNANENLVSILPKRLHPEWEVPNTSLPSINLLRLDACFFPVTILLTLSLFSTETTEVVGVCTLAVVRPWRSGKQRRCRKVVKK